MGTEAQLRGGWYQRLFAWMMSRGNGRYERAMSERKRALFADATGDVLEIGPGAGANFPYYQKNVRWSGIEPNPFMHAYLREAAAAAGIEVNLRPPLNENRLSADDASMDCVVSTLVLCSVPDPAAMLKEVLRVLRPAGRFIFIEHVAAPPGTMLRRVQTLVRPVWKILGDGCITDRETQRLIEQAGFARVRYDEFSAPLPLVSPHVAGAAVK